MNTFSIPEEWKLSSITVYHLNLLSWEMLEKDVQNIDSLLFTQGSLRMLRYSDVSGSEGTLTIPVGRCVDDRCFMQMFGKINGSDFKSVARIGSYSNDEFTVVKQRIGVILKSSQRSLCRYYSESDMTAFQEHLTAFLLVF